MIKGSEVQTDVFLDSTYSRLSAVLFSNAYALELPRPTGTEVVFVHNPKAQNPIERGILKGGREYWLHDDQLYAKDWNKEKSNISLQDDRFSDG
jgi:hypothetical protein